MQKIARNIALVLGIIVMLIALLPFLLKPKISEIVRQQVNQAVEAHVDWERIGLTFFRGFPDLSINLHHLSVIGKDRFEGDTLAAVRRFELRVNPFSAFQKEISLKAVIIEQPVINGIVAEDGMANWDIVPVAADETGTAEDETSDDEPSETKSAAETSDSPDDGQPMKISLERFSIIDGRVSYQDRTGDLSASLASLNLDLKGDFSVDQTDAELKLGIKGTHITMDGIGMMREGSIEVDMEVGADLSGNTYTLKRNEIRINGLVLGAGGTVQLKDDGSIETDLEFFAKETSFATLLSLVPAIYLNDFGALETSGSLALEGSVSGILKDSLLPDASVNLRVSDGYFSYPDLPKDVNDVRISLQVDYRGTDMDRSVVSLEEFHLLLGGNPFDMQVRVTQPFTDMHVSGMIKGLIDFATLDDVVPMEGVDLGGMLEADMNWNTSISDLENEAYERVNLDGHLVIEGLLLKSADLPVPVELRSMDMNFTPRYVELAALDLIMGSSDVHMDGRLSNFIPYIFDNQTISGELNVRSTLIDANELLPSPDSSLEHGGMVNPPAGGDVPEEPTPPPPDSMAVPAQLRIPGNIDFALNLDMDRILFDNIAIDNLSGRMSVANGIAYMDGLGLEMLEGKLDMKGTVDTRGEFTGADVALDIIGISIPASYETFVAVEKLAPVARHCSGNANVRLQLNTLLDASFNPLYGTIDADGHLYTRNLKVESTASLERLSQTLGNEQLRNLELEKLDLDFRIRDGRVMIDPFDIKYSNSTVTVSGSHGIDMSLDYLLDMEIAKSDLGAGAGQLMNSLGALATGAGIQVPQTETVHVLASITGTFREPKIRTDLGGNIGSGSGNAREAVESRVQEEVEQVETRVREEADQKAEELIQQAEAEKARLVEEARLAGMKLVEEAEKQGDKLIGDAGNNPLKRIAAEKAAEKLKEEAEKKSERLIREAEEKGDAMIQKVRVEAGNI